MLAYIARISILYVLLTVLQAGREGKRTQLVFIDRFRQKRITVAFSAVFVHPIFLIIIGIGGADISAHRIGRKALMGSQRYMPIQVEGGRRRFIGTVQFGYRRHTVKHTLTHLPVFGRAVGIYRQFSLQHVAIGVGNTVGKLQIIAKRFVCRRQVAMPSGVHAPIF